MDIEKFKTDCQNPKTKLIIDYSIKQKSWFKYDELVNTIFEISNKRRKSKIKQGIGFLIKIGFLLADPKKELKYNKKFVPINQK